MTATQPPHLPTQQWYQDRTNELIKMINGSSDVNKGNIRISDNEISDFIQDSRQLVYQCELLETSIRQFVSMVDSFDLLLCRVNDDQINHSSTPNNDRKETKTYSQIMREITYLSSSINRLEKEVEVVSDDTAVAFRKGVALYLYSRVAEASQRFRQAEACRLEREAKLKGLFAAAPPAIISCPQLKPSHDTSTEIIFPMSLVGFLPPRWQQVLSKPNIAIESINTVLTYDANEISKSNVKWNSDEERMKITHGKQKEKCTYGEARDEQINKAVRTENNGAERSTTTTSKIVKSNNTAKESQYSKSKDAKLSLGVALSVDEEISEDVCRDLASETQQLLLEREIDTADELQVRQVQRHLEELSIIDTFFANKVLEQQEICDNVVDLVEGSVQQMAQANTELTKTEKKASSYRTFMIAAYLIGAFILLLCDFLTSSKRY